jgi:four helix bundle protein
MTIQNSKFKTEFIKRIIKFSISILNFCEKLKNEKFFWSIIDQLIRSSTSIGANIIEAKSSISKLEYLKYFQIALKSANETKYWLYLIKEKDLKHQLEIEKLLKETIEISKILAAGILTMKGKRSKNFHKDIQKKSKDFF